MRFFLKRSLKWLLGIVCFVFAMFIFLTYSVHMNQSRQWVSHMYIDNAQQILLTGRSDVTLHPKNTEINVTIKSEVKSLRRGFGIWQNDTDYDDDRIVTQLKYKPKWVVQKKNSSVDTIPLKRILIYSGYGNQQVMKEQQLFANKKCAVNTCELTIAKSAAKTADAILYHGVPYKPAYERPPNQIWIMFLLESPYHTPGFGSVGNMVNWTATYRHDSDIVAPYEKFVPYDSNVKFLPQNKSYADGKTKKVAWFVSNCGSRNGRQNYVNELKKYIDVDQYGSCGPLKCPRHDQSCFTRLDTDYKFYLSFENSNCRDYITEKFFVNGLQHDVIPIVMGAAPEDYARAAPPHSFIHVDDFESPKQLAEYLHKLDKNDDLFNEYFRWKGTGSFINTFFWCRVCGMLHDTSRAVHSYRNLEKWWRGSDVCIGSETWREKQRKSKHISTDYL